MAAVNCQHVQMCQNMQHNAETIVMTRLCTARLCCLQVRFLLESASGENMGVVVGELRAKLRLSSGAPVGDRCEIESCIRELNSYCFAVLRSKRIIQVELVWRSA
jgi:hypothetical protein